MLEVSLDEMNLLHVCHDIRMKHVKLDNDYIWNRQFLVHLFFFFFRRVTLGKLMTTL